MPSVKVGPRHQITIPHEIFKKLKLAVGDFFELHMEEERLVLTPAKIIPRDQAWFWNKEWQGRIKEAEDDVKEGRLSGPFKNAKALINHLRHQDENTNN